MKSSNYLNRIHQGDCIDVLAKLPSETADIVITDPPYLCLLYTSPSPRD